LDTAVKITIHSQTHSITDGTHFLLMFHSNYGLIFQDAAQLIGRKSDFILYPRSNLTRLLSRERWGLTGNERVLMKLFTILRDSRQKDKTFIPISCLCIIWQTDAPKTSACCY